MSTRNLVVFCGAVLVFALVIWPGITRYDQMRMGDNVFPVRVNRFTSETQILMGATWVRAAAAAPLDDPVTRNSKAESSSNPLEQFLRPTSVPDSSLAVDFEALAAETTVLRIRLRDAIVAQEAYFAESHTYANDATRLALKSQPGSRLTIAKADAKGWSATIISTSFGISCSMFVGNPFFFAIGPAKVEAVPVCGMR
jgi:hypothetical protein